MFKLYCISLIIALLCWVGALHDAFARDPALGDDQYRAVVESIIPIRRGDSDVALALAPDYLRQLAGTGDSLQGFFARDRISIADGVLELLFVCDPPDDIEPDSISLELIVRGLQPDASEHPSAVVFPEFVAFPARLLVEADMSRSPPGLYRVEGVMRRGDDIIGRVEGTVTNPVYPNLPESFELQVPVDWPTRENRDEFGETTLGFGVPFPTGTLWELPSLSAIDDQGNPVPIEAAISRHWRPAGSIQWLRCWVQTAPTEYLTLRLNSGDAAAEFVNPVTVQPVDLEVPAEFNIFNVINVKVGDTHYRIIRDAGLLTLVNRDGDGVLASGSPFLIDQQGRRARLAPAELDMRLEQSDAARAVVRVEGDYRTSEGARLARCIIRFDFRANFPAVSVTHTLILTENTDEVQFRELGWEWQLAAGDYQQAIFAEADGAQWDSVIPLDQWKSVALAQTAFPAFADDTMRMRMTRVPAGGEPETAEASGSIGDWAGIHGGAGGLLVAVPDFARQFPVDFELSNDRFICRLFSPSAGFEIDLRAPAMVERWKLQDWMPSLRVERYKKATGKKLDDLIKQISSIKMNAVGWARTHEFMVAPLSPDSGNPAALGQYLTASAADPVLIASPPDWTYQTLAMGPLHPRDMERFGYVERWVDQVLAQYMNYCYNGGFAGFFDYRAGPTYRGFSTGTRRYRLTYTFRADIWRYYARSLNKSARRMAEDTNKAFMDNMLCHWDDEGRAGHGTTQGLYFWDGPEGRYDDQPHALPFLGSAGRQRTRLELLSSTNLDQFDWLYQFAGYDRARDIIEQMAEGALRLRESLDRPYRSGRQLMELRVWSQLYRYTGDPQLRRRALELIEYLYQPEAWLKTTAENRFLNSNTYKIRPDIRALMDAYEVFGDPRLNEMILATSEYIWNSTASEWPVQYTSPAGVAAWNLYNELPRADVAVQADFFLRWMAAGYRPDNDRPGLHGRVSASSGTTAFEAVPYLQDIVTRSNADRKILAAWLGFIDTESAPVTVYFKKDDAQAAFNITAAVAAPVNYSVLGERTRVECVSLSAYPNATPAASIMGIIGMHTYTAVHTPADTIMVTADTGAGVYRIVPRHHGEHVVIADRRIPMVLHAPSGWAPMEAEHAWPVFFMVGAEDQNPRVYFDGLMRLDDPAGEPFPAAEPVTGWVDLPADRPGLWKLTIADPMSGAGDSRLEHARWIKVENIQPFFALGDPEFYFQVD